MEYDAMNRQLSQILTSAIEEDIFEKKLDVTKMYLTGIHPKNKEIIKKTSSKVDLMALLRSYFSLSNIAALKDFVIRFKIRHNAKELNDLLKRRNTFYANILAKDFAKKAIQDHKMSKTDSTITFKVSWNQDEATLKEFEIFLSTAFKTHKIFIKLRVVQQSLLTFVCSFPSFLSEEITEYVHKNKSCLISEGVVEVAIDSTVVFSLEEGYAALFFCEPNDILTFTAVRSIQLPALLKFIKKHHPHSEIGLIHYFHFKYLRGFIELKFYEAPPNGWSVTLPDCIHTIKPCRLYQDDIDKFNGIDGSVHPFCQMAVCGFFDHKTKTLLHYPVSLDGVECSVKLHISRMVQTIIPTASIMPYAGLVFCKRKKDKKYLMGFVAVAERNFESLVKYMEDQHPLADIIKLVKFDFASSSGCIKLNFIATSLESSFNSSTAEPQSCKLNQNDIDNSDSPQSCLITFYGSPDAVQSVQYLLILDGLVADTVTLLIDFKLNQTLDLYIGLIYYEWKVNDYLMTFVAGKKLKKLFQYIKEYHPLAEIDQICTFSFSSSSSFIELIFDDFCTGWTVQPLIEPCRLYQNEIDKFDEANYPLPPFCLISVHGSIDALPLLKYSIRLEGVAEPDTLLIERKLQLEKDVLEIFARHQTNHLDPLSLIKQLKVAQASLESLQNALLEQEQQQKQIIEDLKTRLEEEQKQSMRQYLMQEQFSTELRLKLYDKEILCAKMIKEREQLGEIKETSSIGLQVNYLVPLMDNLECLSDVQVAEKKLFLIQGGKPQLMNWEKYGLRIGVQKDSLPSSETVEAAVVALVGGQFQFPPNTVLVSAVYAVSLSKPLLKRLKLEIQHCIDLTGRPDFAQYLKFAIAHIGTPSLPYQFSIVEGGEFDFDSSYGSIQRQQISMVCILAQREKSIGIAEDMKYTGVTYYEQDGVEDLMTFTVTKDLNVLVENIKRHHPQSKIGQHVHFNFDSSSDYIELIFDAPQNVSFKGWTIQPHIKPCRLHRCDIDKFGETDCNICPTSCLVSVHGSPDAVPFIHYYIPLEGVARTVALNIHRAQRNLTDLAPLSTVHESTSVSSTGGASPSDIVDVNKVKKVINDVLVSHYADLVNSLKMSLSDLAIQLHAAHLISDEVRETRSMDKFISEFKASLIFKRKLPQVQEHCQKFLSSFIAVRGSYANAAVALGEDWLEAIRIELGFDFNINIDV